MIKDKLYWERFRPKKLNNVILLPRIKKIVDQGIDTNLLFYGRPGIGKSTVARILVKDTNCLIIDCKKRGQDIDEVREKIDNHIKQFSITPKRNEDGSLAMKTILLEEFDGAQKITFQEPLNNMIELYANYVRFVATVNDTNRIIDTMISRFTRVNFEPQNKEEADFLRDGYLKYLKAIANLTKFEIEDKYLIKMINNSFPDLRDAVQQLQTLTKTKDFNSINENYSSYYLETFKFLTDSKPDLSTTFHYVLDNFRDKTEELLKYLGRPFIAYILQEKPELISKCPQIIELAAHKNETYNSVIDPELHLIHYIMELKKIIHH